MLSQYILKRILTLIPIWLIVGFLTFSIMYMIPGDPVISVLGPGASPEAREAMIQRLHLDEPFLARYWSWFRGILRGDLGQAIFLGRSVTQAIVERAPVTILLGLGAVLFATIIGVPLGVIASVHQNSIFDTAIMITAMLGLSTPEFLLGLFLIFLFGVKWGVLPIGGYVDLLSSPVEGIRHLVMPCFTLGFIWASLVARMTRASMIEILNSDFIRTARSKGLSERIVIWKHALRTVLMPVVTVVGFAAVLIIGGAFITETVFTLPGIGSLAVSSIKRRDYPVVQGLMLVVVTGVLFLNLFVDIIYAYLDPRVVYD